MDNLRELDIQVVASLDDCTTFNDPAQFNTGYATIRAGDWSITQYDLQSGMRFRNVDIPQGAKITAAYLSLRTYGVDTVLPVTIAIEGEAADNPIAFSDVTDYLARARTSVSVNWSPSSWSGWNNSPSIVSIIQELVDRAGWVANNAMVLFLSHASGWGGSQAIIFGRSYDSSAFYAPKLHIEYGAFFPSVTIF